MLEPAAWAQVRSGSRTVWYKVPQRAVFSPDLGQPGGGVSDVETSGDARCPCGLDQDFWSIKCCFSLSSKEKDALTSRARVSRPVLLIQRVSSLNRNKITAVFFLSDNWLLPEALSEMSLLLLMLADRKMTWGARASGPSLDPDARPPARSQRRWSARPRERAHGAAVRYLESWSDTCSCPRVRTNTFTVNGDIISYLYFVYL